MKITPIHFFWTAISSVLIAFTFSLFANPTTYDRRTPDNSNNIASSSSDNNTNNNVGNVIRPQEGEGGAGEDGGGEQKSQTIQLNGVAAPTETIHSGVHEGTRITQTEDEHVKQGNGSMYAIDIVTASGDAYFPEAYSEYFITHIGEDSRIGNYIIIRHGKERWVYGHTVTSRKPGYYVNTSKEGNILGQVNTSGMSTARHVHIERWICPDKESRMFECNNVSSTGQVAPRNKQLKEQRGWVLLIGDNKDNMKSASVIKETNKEGTGGDRKTKPSNEIQVIACLNEKDMTIHETKQGTCFLGNGGRWKNIMLPPQKDIDMFKKVFGDDWKYRLAIANFEGSFREDSGNTYAHGYLQTLRSYKIPPDIESQLNWLKKREEGNTGPACEKYLTENFTLFGTMNIEKGKLAKYTCMGRRHYGAFSPGDPKTEKHWRHSVMYAKRYRVVTEYYLSLNF